MARRNAVLLGCVALVVVVIDQLTKHHFDSAYAVGQHMGGPFLGLFQFTLVHNQGAAWGLFSGSMIPLGVFSLVVCAMILVYLMRFAPDSSLPEALGLSLVFAGGVGNALDRFITGYVVDFIDLTFMDFPVFNVADIGVTCGIVLFLVSFATLGVRRERLREQQAAKMTGKQNEPTDASPAALRNAAADAASGNSVDAASAQKTESDS